MEKIRAESRFEKSICPYCYAKLGIREIVSRKIKGVYQCSNCHKKVDDRLVIR